MLRNELRSIWSHMTSLHLDWIQVEVSTRCLRACAYCPVSRFRSRRQSTFMDMDTFRLMEPDLASADLVFLQGWGEPLLHPRFWDIARRARLAGAAVGFATDGCLLGDDNRRALLDSGVAIVGVSLAGGTPETHERFRMGTRLDTIDRNLCRLREEKERAGTRLPEIHVAYQILADNAAELPAATDLAERWGARQIVVSNLSLVLDESLEYQSFLCKPRDWPARTHIEDARSRAAEQGIRLHAYQPSSGEALPACTENVLASCFVSVRGEVSPCALASLGLERTGAVRRFHGHDYPIHDLTFGNVRHRPLHDIWRSGPARAFRDTFRQRIRQGRTGDGNLPRPCRHCYKLFES
jgi:MoaA/NifB/PqqE/SkfB family radical SAM enzyme